MSNEIERLRAVLEAGETGGLPAPEQLRMLTTGGAATLASNALHALWPALLGVAEATNRLVGTVMGTGAHGYALGELLSARDALDAAIRDHLGSDS